MRVTNIDIADLHYCGTRKTHRGYVTMELHRSVDGARTLVQFICHAAQPQDCPPALVAQDLIEDALRQARRMPGFRRGEAQIVVGAPDPTAIAERLSA